MILQSLTSYYEELLKKGKIPRLGWGKVRVRYALEIDADGALLSVIPLESTDEKGKPAPRYFELPATVKRSVNIDANFLWDNPAYLLGFDSKGDPERAARCFECAKELHMRLLDDIDDPFSKAISAFFNTWTPGSCGENEVIAKNINELSGGANLTFMFNEMLPDSAPELAQAWQKHYNGSADDTGGSDIEMRCLVTGEQTAPVATHPSIMRVRGAQSSGAALVSFNAPAFCSYEREQNYNAPVSKYAAFAYTTALNHLISDRDHTMLIGDTTVVYWAVGGEAQYQDVFGLVMDGSKMTDRDLKEAVEALASGKNANFEGLPLDPENDFYILGLAPNAARLSVRFFLRNSFGKFVEKLKEHYDRLRIVVDSKLEQRDIPMWSLVCETIHYDSKKSISDNMKRVAPQMAGDTLRAILTGSRYPATLFQQALLRVRAEHDVTRGKAAIIKALLIRNYGSHIEEELMNDEKSAAYSLGQLFCVLENIQKAANPFLNTTIKDRYFNSASTNPKVAFPTILRLKNSHIKVIARDKPGLANSFENQIAMLSSNIGTAFPSTLTLEQQGMFILGYYQKRYEKKNTENTEEGK